MEVIIEGKENVPAKKFEIQRLIPNQRIEYLNKSKYAPTI